MRYLLAICLLGTLTTTFAQTVNNGIEFPFQVIYAEKVVDSKGQAIEGPDLISIGEVLTIKEGGFLSMIHFFGVPIEIDGDTTIKIEDVNGLIDNLKGRNKRVKYLSKARPNIDHLFITEATSARKNKLSTTGVCDDCNFDLEIIYPPKYSSNEIYFKGDLCLTWQSTNATAYEVEFRNLFDDFLKAYESPTNNLKIDATEFNELRKGERVLIFRIKDLATNKTSAFSILREFQIDNVDFPFPCTPKSPTSALLTGLYLEMLPDAYINDAEKYFKLAIELSDKVFYKTMLENFKRRRE